jgi:acyl carrier protein
VALEEQHALSGAREERAGGEPAEAAPDDDGVVGVAPRLAMEPRARRPAALIDVALADRRRAGFAFRPCAVNIAAALRRGDGERRTGPMAQWDRETLTQRIFEILRDEILEAGAGFTPRSDLVASGLDSLAVTQLLLALEESTGIWVDESQLTPENLASAEALGACVAALVR